MHAAVVRVRIDPATAAAAAADFSDRILPSITGAPGFRSGVWLEPVQGEGFALIVFDTEAQVRAVTPPEADWNAPGAEIGTVEIRRVAVAV